MTSPSVPVSRRLPLPATIATSTSMTSPPAEVHARLSLRAGPAGSFTVEPGAGPYRDLLPLDRKTTLASGLFRLALSPRGGGDGYGSPVCAH